MKPRRNARLVAQLPDTAAVSVLVVLPQRPTRSDAPSDEPFAEQLALAQQHAALVPMRRLGDAYAPELFGPASLRELPALSGFAAFGLSRALRLVLDVLSALAALHRTCAEDGKPFVHGEVVPQLLGVGADGVARLQPLAPWHWSSAEAVPAHLGYLAPERLLGDKLDPRADIFSVGALLWEALSGRRLFASETAEGIVMRLLSGKITLPDLPPELRWAEPLKLIALRALSVDPAQRFPNCDELKRAIEFAALGHVATHPQLSSYFSAPPAAMERVTPRKSSLSALVTQLDILPDDDDDAETQIARLPSAARAVRVAAPLGSAPAPTLAVSMSGAPPPARGRSVLPGVLLLSCAAVVLLVVTWPAIERDLHAALSGLFSERATASLTPSAAAPLTDLPAPSRQEPRAVLPSASASAEPAPAPSAAEFPSSPEPVVANVGDSPPTSSVGAKATKPPKPTKTKLRSLPAKPAVSPAPLTRPAQKQDNDADHYGI